MAMGITIGSFNWFSEVGESENKIAIPLNDNIARSLRLAQDTIEVLKVLCSSPKESFDKRKIIRI